MSYVFPDSYAVYAYITAGWTDISSYIISDILVSWGITGTKPVDRMASTGDMIFTLNNRSGYFTPEGASVWAGWKSGIPILLQITYESEVFDRFVGTISTLELRSEITGYSEVDVTVVDWMDYAAKHPMILPLYATNQTADNALTTILADMPIPPDSRSFETGTVTFPMVFDLVRAKTVAYSEFSKLILSELGYLYLTKTRTVGECLVMENANHRSGLMIYSSIPLDNASSFDLLKEDGDHLLLETGDNILIDDLTSYSCNNTMLSLEVEHGQDIINHIKVTANPRKVDTSYVVLYSLGSPMQIGAGQTLTFTGNYSDPSGGKACGGTGMVTPVATTDYLLNTASDGSGTNLTATAVVTATYGASSVEYTVRNPSTSSGYITFLQARGYGVYTYAQTVFESEDATSVGQHGYISESLDQPYQYDLVPGELEARKVLFIQRQPHTVLKSITILANHGPYTMNAFLQLDVGSLIHVIETNMGIDNAYLIQNVTFKIMQMGLIAFQYGLKEHWALLTGGLTSLGCSFAGTGYESAINYGYLPVVVQTGPRSYAAWVYDTGLSYGANGNMIISGPSADSGGVLVYIKSDHRPYLYTNIWSTAPGKWATTNLNTLMDGAWHHLVVTYDAWNIAADPIFYVDGAVVAGGVTEIGTPLGTQNSEYGAEVVIGNWHTDTQEYTAAWNGVIKDARIYNLILTAAQVTELYNAGVPDASLVTGGLVFQGPVVKTSDVAAYDGTALDAALPVFENIHQALGIPHDWLYGEAF